MVAYNRLLDIQFNEESVTEPVTLVEAKDFCKIDIGTDDSLITSLITTARLMCEAYTGVGFVEHQAVTVLLNENGGMYIPYGPTGVINSVVDSTGATLILDTDYEISGNQFKRIVTAFTKEITIDYTTGYSTLPDVLKTALLNQIYYLYDNRSQQMDSEMSPIAKMILNPFKRV